MTTRTTIPRLIALLLGGLFVLLLLASSALIFNGFIQVEHNQTAKVLARAQAAYANELTELNTKATDWSDWDDAWDYVCGLEPSFPAVNLMDSAFADLDINTILFVNDGDVNAPKAGCIQSSPPTVLSPATQIVLPYDSSVADTPIPQDLTQALSAAGSPILNHHGVSASDHLTYYQTGVINLKEGPFLYAARPIIHSDNSGPLAGTIIFGRYLDAGEVQKIATLTHLVTPAGKPTISFTSLNSPSLSADEVSAIKSLKAGKSTVIKPLNNNLIAGYSLIKDYRGDPALVLRIETARPILSQGLKSIFYFDIALLAIGLIFGSVTLLLLQRSIIRPIAKLADSAATAANSKNYSGRIPVEGKDELSRIAESLDKILDELEASGQLRSELSQLQQLEKARSEASPTISQAEAAPHDQPGASVPTQPSPPPPPPSVDTWTEGGGK